MFVSGRHHQVAKGFETTGLIRQPKPTKKTPHVLLPKIVPIVLRVGGRDGR